MSILSFVEARHTVERTCRELVPAAVEIAGLLQSQGRILAEAVETDRDLPPFPRSTRDGYAVRSADLTSIPAWLHVEGEVRAGVAWMGKALASGQAIEIMTGAPVPPGADAVAMVEHTSRDGDRLAVNRAVAPGENIVPQGSEAIAGSPVLHAGTRIDAAAIALAASVGQWELAVFTVPQVAILATGDELVEVTARPGPAQIRNSNSYSLAAQVAQAGAVPVILPVSPDRAETLHEAIRQGLASDLLLLTGGVSMGKYDLVEEILAELRAEFFFTGALIQPGRPVVFGRIPAGNDRRRLFFGLPGNPVSTMVTFELFVRPVIAALSGAAPEPLVFLQARLKSDLRTKTGLTRFLPARLEGEFERAEVEPVRWQGSGDIAATTLANCYLVVPPDRETLGAGDFVSVMIKS